VVGLHQLAGPHALGIAKLGDTGADELVDGGDVGLGGQEQPVDGEGMPADEGLALDGLLAGDLDREGALRGHPRDQMSRLGHGGRSV